jgi:amino acid transporter
LNGGASVAMWDWIIMSIIYVCIATSLGEIASLYPVSGGVYYWSFMLSPPKHAPLVSWIVGWLSVIGNVVVTLSVNFATTQLILSSVNRESFKNRNRLSSDPSLLSRVHPCSVAHCAMRLGFVSGSRHQHTHVLNIAGSCCSEVSPSWASTT